MYESGQLSMSLGGVDVYEVQMYFFINRNVLYNGIFVGRKKAVATIDGSSAIIF